MSVNSTVSCTQKLHANEIYFAGLPIPHDLLVTEIFSKVVHYKDVNSLLRTHRYINKLILDNNQLWAHLWERRFTSVSDFAKTGFNPVEAYKEILPLIYPSSMKIWIHKIFS